MNKWNPKGLRRNHRGQLLDKWGREMEVDWAEYDKKRLKPGDQLKSPKVLNPMHAAATPKRTAESVVNKMLEADDLSPEEMQGYVDKVRTGVVMIDGAPITRVVSSDGKDIGVPTGGTRFCPLEGCGGLRIGVRWADRKITWPCTRGMNIEGECATIG